MMHAPVPTEAVKTPHDRLVDALRSCQVHSLLVLRTIRFQARQHVSELRDHDQTIALAVLTPSV